MYESRIMTYLRFRKPARLRAVSFLLVLIVVSASALAAAPETISVSARRAGISPNIPIYGYVGDQPLTGLQLRSNLRGVEAHLTSMRADIAQTQSESQRQMLEDVVRVIDDHGIVTAAVAGAVLDLTLYARAIEWGLVPSDAEVETRVSRDRERLRSSGRALLDERFSGEVDEQTFWNEWYPSIIRQRLAIDRLYFNRMAKLYSYGDLNPNTAWYKQTVDFVEQSSLVWVADDGQFTVVTHAQVVAYLAAMADALPTEPLDTQPLDPPEVVLFPVKSSDSTA